MMAHTERCSCGAPGPASLAKTGSLPRRLVLQHPPAAAPAFCTLCGNYQMSHALVCGCGLAGPAAGPEAILRSEIWSFTWKMCERIMEDTMSELAELEGEARRYSTNAIDVSMVFLADLEADAMSISQDALNSSIGFLSHLDNQ